MSWKMDLDKWLTTPPEDKFDSWCEEVIDNFSDSFFEKNEEWINQPYGLCSKWMNKIFSIERKDAKGAAKIIERTFELYKLYENE